MRPTTYREFVAPLARGELVDELTRSRLLAGRDVKLLQADVKTMSERLAAAATLVEASHIQCHVECLHIEKQDAEAALAKRLGEHSTEIAGLRASLTTRLEEHAAEADELRAAVARIAKPLAERVAAHRDLYTQGVELLERTSPDEDTAEAATVTKSLQEARGKLGQPTIKPAERDELQRSIVGSELRLAQITYRRLSPENFKLAKA